MTATEPQPALLGQLQEDLIHLVCLIEDVQLLEAYRTLLGKALAQQQEQLQAQLPPLSAEDIASIDRGIAQLSRGEGIPATQAMAHLWAVAANDEPA